MLDPDRLGVRSHELAYETRVPQFRSDAQVFTAAHQGVGLAALGCSRDAIVVEIGLFTTGD